MNQIETLYLHKAVFWSGTTRDRIHFLKHDDYREDPTGVFLIAQGETLFLPWSNIAGIHYKKLQTITEAMAKPTPYMKTTGRKK